jgi:ubiquinone biosynthesis protein
MKYYGLTLREVNIRSILNDVTSLIRRYNLRMPANLALLIKTVSMEESLVKVLYPDFNFAEAMTPYARRVWDETRSPIALARRGFQALAEYADIGTRAPRQVRRILGQLSRGELGIVTNSLNIREELSRISSMVNRLIAGILFAAILTSISLLVPFFGNLAERRKSRRKG